MYIALLTFLFGGCRQLNNNMLGTIDADAFLGLGALEKL